MDLITAIKSGKPFKRKADSVYISMAYDVRINLSVGDILATDWEIEEPEPKVEITESEFWKAVRNARVKESMDRSYVYVGVADQANHEMMAYVAEQLFGKKGK